MQFVSAIAAICLGLAQLFGVAEKGNVGRVSEEVRILPVSRTVESDSILLTIAFPKEGSIVSGNPAWIQFRIDGYALGADSSQFDRSNQVPVSDMGQTVHVVIDNEPYFPVNEPAINPFNETGYYRYTSYKFELPYSLKEGTHILRIFPARSYGESLKGANTLHSTFFHLGKASDSPPNQLSKPYLTYNEPGNHISWNKNQPVLLDFLVTNCELSPDGFKVRLSIDGNITRTLTAWQPYYIYGLFQGSHKIRLELLDGNGSKAAGSFNDVERTISVY